MSDKELKSIASLPRLKILAVHKDRYGDFGNSLFSSGLVGLTELDLTKSDYIDEDIWRHLKRLGQLRKLNLKRTKINEADLRGISNFTELTELNISQNDITDSGLLKHVMNFSEGMQLCQLVTV